MTLETSSFKNKELPFRLTKLSVILSVFPCTVRLQIFRDAIAVLETGLKLYGLFSVTNMKIKSKINRNQ